MEREKIVLQIECPCSGTATYTETCDGKPLSLLHTLPMCDQFRDLEPDQYIRWIRGKIEGRYDA